MQRVPLYPVKEPKRQSCFPHSMSPNVLGIRRRWIYPLLYTEDHVKSLNL